MRQRRCELEYLIPMTAIVEHRLHRWFKFTQWGCDKFYSGERIK